MQRLKRAVKISVSFLIKKNVINNDYFVLLIILFTFYNSVHIYVLINSRASATVFINADFVKLHYLKLHSLKH